jgi:hypothetical protein
VLHEAHKIRVKAGDANIEDKHIADALISLSERAFGSLSR